MMDQAKICQIFSKKFCRLNKHGSGYMFFLKVSIKRLAIYAPRLTLGTEGVEGFW